MTLSIIKEKIHKYIENGNPKKVKAIFAMIEDDIEDENVFTAAFIKELDKRQFEIDKGLVKTYSWDEVKASARKKVRVK